MLFPEKSGLYKLAVVKLERYNCPHFQSLHVNFKCLWSSHLVLASVYTIRLLYGHLGACGFFKEFSFAVASFHPSWSCSGFWLAYKRLALPSVLLVNVWDLAVSLSAYTSKNFSPILVGREEGVGLTCFSLFFTDYTENAVVLTSGLSVLLASNQYCSDLLLLECIVKRLEYD